MNITCLIPMMPKSLFVALVCLSLGACSLSLEGRQIVDTPVIFKPVEKDDLNSVRMLIDSGAATSDQLFGTCSRGGEKQG